MLPLAKVKKEKNFICFSQIYTANGIVASSA